MGRQRSLFGSQDVKDNKNNLDFAKIIFTCYLLYKNKEDCFHTN